jgi:hypothetical protein
VISALIGVVLGGVLGNWIAYRLFVKRRKRRIHDRLGQLGVYALPERKRLELPEPQNSINYLFTTDSEWEKIKDNRVSFNVPTSPAMPKVWRNDSVVYNTEKHRFERQVFVESTGNTFTIPFESKNIWDIDRTKPSTGLMLRKIKAILAKRKADELQRKFPEKSAYEIAEEMKK